MIHRIFRVYETVRDGRQKPENFAYDAAEYIAGFYDSRKR